MNPHTYMRGVRPSYNLSTPHISQHIIRKYQTAQYLDFVRDSDSQSESESSKPKVDPVALSSRSRLMCINRPSLLSAEYGSKRDLSGFLNLAMMILIVSHLRLMLMNATMYGILLNPAKYVLALLENPEKDLTTLTLFISYNFWIIASFLCEKLIIKLYDSSRKKEEAKKKKDDDYHEKSNEKEEKKKKRKNLHSKRKRRNTIFWIECLAFILHFILLSSLFVATYLVIETQRPNPVFGILLMTIMTVLFLKLASYAAINHSLRKTDREAVNLPNIVHYPNNVTLSNIYYFIAIPTLVYEENFPRTQQIRWKFIGKLVVEMICYSLAILFIVEQYILPLVQHAMKPLTDNDIIGIIERIMKLTVPNIIVWVIGFYVLFHLMLNISAELLKFGDRLFYLDWWNSTSLDYFWRTWNLPVHKWVVIHIYAPLLRRNFSPAFASFMTFFVSAIFHELIISIPFHTIKLWAFSAMLVQMPLCYLTRKYTKGKVYGNLFLWFSFMFGQANCVIMYYRDFTKQIQNPVGPSYADI